MTDSAYTLYLATNTVNGKQYVGLSKEFHKRVTHHKCAKSNSAFHHKHTAETKQKISKANSNRSPEMRATFASAQKGKIRSPEFKARVSATSTGRKHSPETIAKIKASWVKRKQAKAIASTIVNNFMNKETHHGVPS